MNLTRIYLNRQLRGGKKLLGSPHAMHAAIMAGFAPDSGLERVLWRIDGKGSKSPVLYVVSQLVPDLRHIAEQAGWPEQSPAVTRDYQPMLDRLADGQRWAIRLTANPTHRGRGRGGKQQILGHVTANQQLSWLLSRQDRIGLSLTEQAIDATGKTVTVPTINLVGREILKFYREGKPVTISAATFSGTGVVRDHRALRQVLQAGLGRAKAYGCGLLTLAEP